MDLRLAGRTVASYVLAPSLDPTLSPRPFLHPIRTVAGTVVSDALPEDHRWHLGLSLAMQDVNRNNLWGGRTYVRDAGYTWLADHGSITHEGFAHRSDDRLVQRLAWRGHDGGILLAEERTITATLDGADGGGARGWVLELSWRLRAATDVVLGSPATNGRPDGAGYGGCFWRGAPGTAEVRAGVLTGEEQVNGCAEPQLRWQGETGGAPYTLIFSGLGPGDRWFVRTGIYPGVCAAWAFEQPRVLGAGQTHTGGLRVQIRDGID